MSNKLRDLVYTLELPPHLRDVLLVLADHAKPDGSDAWPGVELIAWKLDKTPRSVQRSLRRLEDPDRCGAKTCTEAFIHAVRHANGGRGKATEYLVRIPVQARRKPPLQPENRGLFEVRDVTLSAPATTEERVTPGVLKGDIAVSPQSPKNPPKPSDATRLVPKARMIDPDALDIARELRASLEEHGRTYFARDWHLTSAAAIGSVIRSGVSPGEVRDAIAWAFGDGFWCTRVRHGHDLQQILPQFQLSRAGPATNGNGHTPYDHAAAIANGFARRGT